MSDGPGLGILEGWIAMLRKLPKTMVEEAAPEMAKELKSSIEKSVAAGESPNGDTWAPSKSGKPVLVNAASHVDVTVSGTTITATLDGVEAFHHYGTKKLPKRQILPSGSNLPPTLADAFQQGLIKRFSNATKGK